MTTIHINGYDLPAESRREGGKYFSADAANTNYIILTCYDDLTAQQENQLRDLGVHFLGSLDRDTYRCRYEPSDLNTLRSLPFVEDVTVYHPDFAIHPGLKDRLESLSIPPDEAWYTALLHEKELMPATETELIKFLSPYVTAERIGHEGQSMLIVPIKRDDVVKVAHMDNVEVISKIEPKYPRNHKARGVLRCPQVTASAPAADLQRYRGFGQTVVVADSGFDLGETDNVHAAFTGRVIDVVAWAQPAPVNYRQDSDGHGTHVAGSILGSGDSLKFGKIEGTAPAANLIMQNIEDRDGSLNAQPNVGGVPRPFQDLFREGMLGANPARVHNNSWGDNWPKNGMPVGYDNATRILDDFVSTNQDCVIVWAAGNDGIEIRDLTKPTIQTTALAKNAITVGACDNQQTVRYLPVPGYIPRFRNKGYYTYQWYNPNGSFSDPDSMSPFSDRGPDPFGRIKPDVVAPGTTIYSTRSRYQTLTSLITSTIFSWFTWNAFGTSPDSSYWFCTGTSMSTPLVAGMCAVIRNVYCLKKTCYPSAAMVKALLVNGADDITSNSGSNQLGPPPNGLVGFGRANLEGALLPLTDTANGGCDETQQFDINNVQTVDNHLTAGGPSFSCLVTVSSVPATLTATMAYPDPGSQGILNKVSLRVVTPNGTKNQFAEPDPKNPTRAAFRNNVQRLALKLTDNADVGEYELIVEYVRSNTVPVPTQHVALCWHVKVQAPPPASSDWLPDCQTMW